MHITDFYTIYFQFTTDCSYIQPGTYILAYMLLLAVATLCRRSVAILSQCELTARCAR